MGEGELCPSHGRQLLFHSLFMSLQQSFFWLHNCMSQMQDFREKVLCSHQCGCSQLPCHQLMATGEREAVHLCVPESPARRWRGLLGAESPLPTSKCDFESYPYKSFWQLFLLGTQSVQHCEFSQVFPWHAMNVLSDEMSVNQSKFALTPERNLTM